MTTSGLSDFSLSNIREVTIESRGPASSKSIAGLFALSVSDDMLDLIIADNGSMVYRTHLAADDISKSTKVPSSHKNPIQFLVSLLLPKQTTTTGATVEGDNSEPSSSSSPVAPPYPETTFTRMEDDDSLRIQVLQKTPLGLVRKPWTWTLQRDRTTTMMMFTGQIMEHQKALEHQVTNLQSNLESVASAHDDWKDTAEKLEGGWEKEKSELLRNFLVLYTKKKEQAAEFERRVQQLQTELQKKEEELAKARQAASKPAPPECLLENQPDDNDQVLYDADEVARLAAGPKKVAQKRKRAPSVKKTARRTKSENDHSSGEDDSTPSPTQSSSLKRKPPPEKKRRAVKSKKAKPTSEESETTSSEEEDFLDNDMRNDILAQIAELAKSEDS